MERNPRCRVGSLPMGILALALLLVGLCAVPAGAEEVPKVSSQISPKRILLLYSYGYGGKGVRIFDDGLFATLGAAGISATDVHAEFLDLGRTQADPAYHLRLRDLLLRKYAARPIDLIITVQQPALHFLLREGSPLAPGAPVITLQAPPPSPAEAGGRRFLCQVAQFDIPGTLQLARTVFPRAARLVIVAGNSEADQQMAAAARAAAQGRFAIEDTSHLPLAQMLERVAHLPPHSVILFTQFNRDTTGRVTVAYEVEGLITRVANAPVFGLYDFTLHNGGLGGSVVSVHGLGETTGQAAIALLTGQRQLIQPVTVAANRVVPMVDWGQLERWDGDTSQLPEGTVIQNRPPSFWSQYQGYVLAALAVLGVQAALIAGLLVQQRRRAGAEAALRESDARYRALFDLAPSGSVLIAPDSGQIVQCNAQAAALLGYTHDELTQCSIPALEAAEQPHEVREHLETIIATGHDSFETRLRTKDGREVAIGVTACRMEIGGRPHALAVWNDLTAHKKAEAEKARLQVQLLQSQKLEAVGQLAGGVAHDFNNLLSVILGQAALLLDDLPATDPLRPDLVEIRNAAERAADLTRQLLLFSRRQAAQKIPLEVNQLLGNLLKMLRRLLGEHISLEFTGSAAECWVTADPGMLEQVVTNLAVNARDAMPGGGRITIRTEMATIDAGRAATQPKARPGTFICLTVQDTGSGIPPEVLPHIFDPFFTTKGVGKGTGLGLAMVYGIVTQHEGWLEVDSTVGQGTTIRVFLPATPGAAVAPAAPAPMAPRGTETLLLVEDEAAVRRMYTAVLSRLGYRVLEARTGPEALAVWAAHREAIALLLTDMVLPGGMTGLDLVARLRMATPTLRAVLMSGYSVDLTGPGPAAPPGLTFLQKPLAPSVVARAVRTELDRRREGDG